MDETTRDKKRRSSYSKTYCKLYYQRNKARFKKYYLDMKMKRLHGVETPTKPLKKKTRLQKTRDHFERLDRQYQIRRAKWLAENMAENVTD